MYGRTTLIMQEGDNTVRVALYTRVSDEHKQADGLSLTTQLTAMQQWATQHNHVVVAEFSETEGASEYSEGRKRTKLNEAMELARTKQIDLLMYYKPDRFTRSPVDGVMLRDELYKLGIEVWTYYPYPHQITKNMEVLSIRTHLAQAKL